MGILAIGAWHAAGRTERGPLAYRTKIEHGRLSIVVPCVVGVLLDDRTAEDWDAGRGPAIAGCAVQNWAHDDQEKWFDDPSWFIDAQSYHDAGNLDGLRQHLEAAIA